METEHEALEAGERLKALLLAMVEKYNVAMETLSGANVGTGHLAKMENALTFVHEQVRPEYSGVRIILYRAGRAERTFDVEYNRLRNRTLHRVLAAFEGPEEVKAYRDDPRNGIRVDLLAQLTVNVATQVTQQLLMAHPEFGDELYLLINHLMTRAPEATMCEIMALGDQSPPQYLEALYGILGLLEQAKMAQAANEVVLAQTLLMDANHLLGLHEGATYVMQRLMRVAGRRRASKNASKSHGRTDALKARVEALFDTLRPVGPNGRPVAWSTPKAAFDAIWLALYNSAAGEERDQLEKAERTIRRHCKLLVERAINGDRIQIQVVGPAQSGDVG